jgi:hypothetical protein
MGVEAMTLWVEERIWGRILSRRGKKCLECRLRKEKRAQREGRE